MKYRQKPVVIEAFHWVQENASEPDPEWLVEAMDEGTVDIEKQFPSYKTVMLIKTLEGTMTANDGDYIIKGVNGEIYPCKPDIFEKTYEKVEE